MANHDHFELIKQRFGNPEFRPLQREAIAAHLDGRDSLVIMPTGGGKSLCYQGPAVALGGLTVVISPLIALMDDQLAALRAKGVAAAAIHSHEYRHEQDATTKEVLAGKVNLLYVAPERVLSPSMVTLLARVQPRAFVIDECHCVSTWGHDFRPDYRRLVDLRRVFSRAAFHAFTATCTPLMRDDIVDALQLRVPVVVRGGADRPNLHLKVFHRPSRNSDATLLMSVLNYCVGDVRGIVYANTKKHVEKLFRELEACDEMRPVMYHAGMDAPLRRAAQKAFTSGDANVVVATVAFGMGIDVPDIRFVFHARAPESLERYHQEIGRAGRDGQPSDCIMFYRPEDIDRAFDLVETADPPLPNEEERLRSLAFVTEYAEGDCCRAVMLAEHFGESKAFPCGHCDVCKAFDDRIFAAVGLSEPHVPASGRSAESPAQGVTT